MEEKLATLIEGRKRILPIELEHLRELVDHELDRKTTEEEQWEWITAYYEGVDLFGLDYIQDDRFIWGRCINEQLLFMYATTKPWLMENNIDVLNLSDEDRVALKLKWDWEIPIRREHQRDFYQ